MRSWILIFSILWTKGAVVLLHAALYYVIIYFDHLIECIATLSINNSFHLHALVFLYAAL